MHVRLRAIAKSTGGAGGDTSKQLYPAQRDHDQIAPLQISCKLGHEREQIIAVYLGDRRMAAHSSAFSRNRAKFPGCERTCCVIAKRLCINGKCVT